MFNNLGHLLSLEMLEICFHSLDGTKAVGEDKVTKEEYGKNLTDNLNQLLTRIRRGSYRPGVSRIVEIPKIDGSSRPLAISCFEDKIVQEAVRRVLERIYEPVFVESSYGFRPGRNCHQAIMAVREALMGWDCRAVLEIDLRKYFNTIPHDRMVQLLRLKISDERFLRLVIKLLKAPTRDADGLARRNEIGSPQGSILSPLLANIYLHYVLDIWFPWIIGKQLLGRARMVRYADDAVFVFGNCDRAEKFKVELVKRLKSFGIAINESKTKVLASGRYEAVKHERRGATMPSFTFLGFLFVWGISVNTKSGKRFWRVKTRSCPKRFRGKLAILKDMIRRHRHEKDLISRVKRVVEGYLNYFAVTDNLRRVSQFTHEVKRMLYRYLNRRSQRRSLDWVRFTEILAKEAFPKPLIRRSLIRARAYSAG